MSIRLLADADLKFAIVTGTRLHEPAIDFVSAVEADLEGVGDPEVLQAAASQERILVSHDKKTSRVTSPAFSPRETEVPVSSSLLRVFGQRGFVGEAGQGAYARALW